MSKRKPPPLTARELNLVRESVARTLFELGICLAPGKEDSQREGVGGINQHDADGIRGYVRARVKNI